MDELNKHVVSHILSGSAFSSLPGHVKQAVGNEKQYNQIVLKYCLKRQMPWKSSLLSRIMPDERQYYSLLVKTSRTELMVFIFIQNFLLI